MLTPPAYLEWRVFHESPVPSRFRYEIAHTPPEKLHLLTHGASTSDLADLFADVDVAEAGCFDKEAEKMIRDDIVRRHQSESALTKELKLLLGDQLAAMVSAPSRCMRTPLASR